MNELIIFGLGVAVGAFITICAALLLFKFLWKEIKVYLE